MAHQGHVLALGVTVGKWKVERRESQFVQHTAGNACDCTGNHSLLVKETEAGFPRQLKWLVCPTENTEIIKLKDSDRLAKN